jgi:LacI family transcriptional regulator
VFTEAVKFYFEIVYIFLCLFEFMPYNTPMANQRDVAAFAQVSSASVSRYLTDPKSVKKATALRIEQAISELNYQPDHIARSLKTGRGNHIGILLPGNGPFFWEILQGMEDRLTRSGYFANIFYTRDVDDTVNNTRDNLKTFLRNKLIEGIVYFPLLVESDKSLFTLLKEQHENIVVVDYAMNDLNVDQITIDNYEAGIKAAKAFIGLGHKEFLYLTGMAQSFSAGERERGFRDELLNHGFELNEDRIIYGDFTSKTAYEESVKFLRSAPPFTAVFAASDSSAIAFMRAASERNIICPNHYSIIGFDNNIEFGPYTVPSLSSFQQPLNELGIIAAEKLINQIKTGHASQHIMLQTEFVQRESLAPAPFI